MKRDTFYNDNDRNVCAWLRQLAKDGHVSPGTVNETSIAQLSPDDVRGYRRVHFFSGIGGWDYAIKLAGWPDDREVWTGSCPCQPFSVAGKGKGTKDERHLWPEMRRLIAECLPSTVFGEQVASKAGREWFAGVRTDLEALGYAVGCADLCAASVGAPHIRQRLFWVADRNQQQGQPNARAVHGLQTKARCEQCQQPSCSCEDDGLPVTQSPERNGLRAEPSGSQGRPSNDCGACGLLDSASCGCTQGHGAIETGQHRETDYWARYTTVACGDGKTRRIEPGLAPLVDGVPARVVRIRGYGNAIVPKVAAEFVMAFMEAERGS